MKATGAGEDQWAYGGGNQDRQPADHITGQEPSADGDGERGW